MIKKRLTYKGYRTDYTVYSDGRIYDERKHDFVNVCIKQASPNRGKYRAYIYLRNVSETVLPRVVCYTFNPISDDELTYLQVNHIDGDPLNNHISNLEWVTGEENMAHAKENNLLPFGEDHWNSKYSDELINNICRDIVNGVPRYKIKERYNVNGQLIDDIRSGRSHDKISSQYDNFPYKNFDRNKIEELVHNICQDLQDGVRQYVITKKYNLTNKCFVSDIKHGRTYREISSNYNF